MQQTSQRKISIITPVYNSGQQLRATIDSVITQKYKNWELILIDDGSSDNSGKICDEYAQKDYRIKVFHQQNKGVSAARNLALDHMTGDYVTFVDSDDWIESDYLSHFMEFSFSENQIIYQGFYMDYVGAVAKPSTKEIPVPGQVLHLGAIWGKVFTTQIIKEHRIMFDERLTLHEDHVFYYDCLRYACRLDFSPHAGYHYMHYGKLSLSRKLQSSKSYFLASELLMEYYPHDTTANDAKYKRFCLQKFGLNQMIMGIFSLYFEPDSRKERLNILREKQKLASIFRQNYVPNSLNGRLFLYSYLHFSPIVQDFIFWAATSLLGKHFKSKLNLR